MLGFSLVVLASFMWAIDTLIRYPLLGSGVTPDQLVFGEHLFLVIFFLPLFLKRKETFLEFKISHFFGFLVIGVFGSAIATLAFTEAFRLINPSLVIIMQKLQPFVAVFFARILLGEKPKKEFWPLMILTIIGVFLVSAPELWSGLKALNWDIDLIRQSFKKESALGLLLTMIAVVSWGASTVFGKKLSQSSYSPNAIMAGRFFFGFVFLSFYLWANQSYQHFTYNPLVWSKILGMVTISGLLGMYLYYRGLKLISARAAAIAELFFPLASVCINWVLLNKPLEPIQILGAILMLGSATFVQWKNY